MESTRFDGRSIKVKAAIVGTFDAIVVPKFFDIYPIEIDWFILSTGGCLPQLFE